VAQVDPDSGKTYYYHKKKRTTRWDKPLSNDAFYGKAKIDGEDGAAELLYSVDKRLFFAGLTGVSSAHAGFWLW
jgi:hypothetical protein